MTKTKGKIITKCIAFVLAVLIGFYAVPSIVYAQVAEALTSEDSASVTTESTDTVTDVAAGIYEVLELREESLKTFRQSDGSYVAAYYPTPVHRLDEDGNWVDIDNTLASSGAEYSTNDARVKFSKKITGNGNIFTLHENNTKITLSLSGAIKKTKGEIKAAEPGEEETDELSKLMSLENLNSAIIYENILDGVDIEYIVSGNDIKENIIAKERKDEYVYTFTLKLNNLTASLTPSGAVEIVNDGGELAYEIPAPIIYDANGVYAEDGVGAYTLLDNGNGSYTLTVTANAEWMNAEERAFPVTVDPTVSTPNSNITDLFIMESAADSTFSTSSSLLVGGGCVTYWKMNSMKQE